MNHSLAIGGQIHVALMVLVLLGCASPERPEATPNTSPTPTTSAPTMLDEAPRFVIDCAYPDGSSVGTFTRLEEAWASTNYVRIDHCDARATSDDVELTREEQAIAVIAARDLAGEPPVDLFLRALAACVRIAPDAAEGIDTYPTSLLEATLDLCPEAPHAQLIVTELGTRGG